MCCSRGGRAGFGSGAGVVSPPCRGGVTCGVSCGPALGEGPCSAPSPTSQPALTGWDTAGGAGRVTELCSSRRRETNPDSGGKSGLKGQGGEEAEKAFLVLRTVCTLVKIFGGRDCFGLCWRGGEAGLGAVAGAGAGVPRDALGLSGAGTCAAGLVFV